MRAFAGLLGALFLAVPCAADQMDVSYGPDSRQRLDVLGEAPGRKSPAVLLIHGGGFIEGDRGGFAVLAPSFVAHGIVVISVDYRLADGAAENRWPAQLEDAQLAVRWARAHANELGIDPQHICALGGSAGAQLSLLLGVLLAIEPGDMADRLAEISPRVDCVIAVSAPTDFVSWGPHPYIDQKLFGHPTLPQLLSASPALRLNSAPPPILLVHGTADRLTPLAQGQEMRDALARRGFPVSFVTHGGAHSFAGLKPKDRLTVLSLAARFVLSPLDSPQTLDLDAQ